MIKTKTREYDKLKTMKVRGRDQKKHFQFL